MSSQQRLHEAAYWLASLHCLAEADDKTRKLIVHHDDGMAEDVRRVLAVVDPPALHKSRGRSRSAERTTAGEYERRESC